MALAPWHVDEPLASWASGHMAELVVEPGLGLHAEWGSVEGIRTQARGAGAGRDCPSPWGEGEGRGCRAALGPRGGGGSYRDRMADGGFYRL